MQLARSILLVAFSLLGSAATAHPEWAWVLWPHDRYDYAKLERFEVYDSAGRRRDLPVGFYERLIFSGNPTGVALPRE
jgi:hypothetical protein